MLARSPGNAQGGIGTRSDVPAFDARLGVRSGRWCFDGRKTRNRQPRRSTSALHVSSTNRRCRPDGGKGAGAAWGREPSPPSADSGAGWSKSVKRFSRGAREVAGQRAGRHRDAERCAAATLPRRFSTFPRFLAFRRQGTAVVPMVRRGAASCRRHRPLSNRPRITVASRPESVKAPLTCPGDVRDGHREGAQQTASRRPFREPVGNVPARDGWETGGRPAFPWRLRRSRSVDEGALSSGRWRRRGCNQAPRVLLHHLRILAPNRRKSVKTLAWSALGASGGARDRCRDEDRRGGIRCSARQAVRKVTIPRTNDAKPPALPFHLRSSRLVDGRDVRLVALSGRDCRSTRALHAALTNRRYRADGGEGAGAVRCGGPFSTVRG